MEMFQTDTDVHCCKKLINVVVHLCIITDHEILL